MTMKTSFLAVLGITLIAASSIPANAGTKHSRARATNAPITEEMRNARAAVFAPSEVYSYDYARGSASAAPAGR